MKPEDKELLIRDLCARLPYGVKYCRDSWNYEWDQEMSVVEVLEDIDKEGYINYHKVYKVDDIKPYLRPMSSMTEDERKQLSEYIFSEKGRRYFTIQSNGILYSGIDNLCFIGLGDDTIDRLIDWLNEHHFDVRNLIEKNLALEAPSGMYKK